MEIAYIKEVGNILQKDSEKSITVYHRCIAALICDQGKSASVAVICTGTRYNNTKDCYRNPPSPCDMHAESLCYDIAPVFFQMEMLECLKPDGKESIFTHSPNGLFKLKDGVKFHLLITEPPCGWCQDGQEPCFEWKRSTAALPHVPTCSSKILINSEMGIQGYVSHLLEKRIFVDTVTILYDKKKTITFKPTIQFKQSNELPEFKLKEYDPERFKYDSQKTFHPMNLMSSTDSDTNVPSPSDGSGSNVKGSSQGANAKVSIAAAMQRQGEHFLQIYDSNGKMTPYHPLQGLEKPYKVHERLVMSVEDELQNKIHIKLNDSYKKLKDTYLQSALEHYQNVIEDKIRDQTKKLQDLTVASDQSESISQRLIITFKDPIIQKLPSSKALSDFIEELCKKLQNEVKKEGNTYLQEYGILKRINDNLKSNYKDVCLDCSWDKYLEKKPTFLKPTEAKQ